MRQRPPRSTLFPSTTLFRSVSALFHSLVFGNKGKTKYSSPRPDLGRGPTAWRVLSPDDSKNRCCYWPSSRLHRQPCNHQSAACALWDSVSHTTDGIFLSGQDRKSVV